MKYGIVVDSSCDLMQLPEQYAQLADYSRVPLRLDVGETQFVDDAQLDVEQFLAQMSAYSGKTGSAAPGPQEWLSACEKSQQVFIITITSRLSACYSSAQIAAEMFRAGDGERRALLIDSQSTGPAMILLVYRLLELIERGLDFDAVCREISAYQPRIQTLVAIEHMDNLIKNGRVSKLAGGLAGVLGIRLLCVATEGLIEVLSKCRGKLGVYNKLFAELLTRGFSGGPVVITHCRNREGAMHLRSLLLARFPDCVVQIMPTRGLCSYYAEIGGLIVGAQCG